MKISNFVLNCTPLEEKLPFKLQNYSFHRLCYIKSTKIESYLLDSFFKNITLTKVTLKLKKYENFHIKKIFVLRLSFNTEKNVGILKELDQNYWSPS